MSTTPRRVGSRRSRAGAILSVTALALGAAATAAGPATAVNADHAHHLSTSRPDLSGTRLDASQRLGAVPDSGRYTFLLKLDVPSTSTAYRQARRGATPRAGRDAARRQLSRVTAAQNAVIRALPARTPVLYRTHAALPAVAVTTNVRNFSALSSIRGVTAVYPIAPKTHENSYAVPLQGAPAAWEGNGDLGEGTRVAVIDTGIDFTHANFGGPGTKAAYETEHAHADDPTLWSDSIFPTTKVVAGYDLVGDAYDADPGSETYNPVPTPDPNPLDCEGHGSHVAGTVAGYGENADGTTYTGAYNTSTDFSSMRIGPGMAPQASLVAIRVFGCTGSTDVVGQAIDLAMDPNGDGDPSDAVDVVNMSLGSDFGAPDDGDAVMANAASDAGVTMAISSGNSYDLYDVGGSPGTAQKAITVAAAVDAQSVVDGLNVDVDGAAAPDAPYAAERSTQYDWANEPDLSGEVVDLGADVTGCDPFTPEQAAQIADKVVILKWTDDNLECGSVARSGNVADAGGRGFVFASNLETFSAGIYGSDVIPGVLVNHSGGQAIRDAIAAGKTVSVTGTAANAVTQTFPKDDDKVTDFSSRGIRGAGNLKPDVSAVGATVFSTAVGTGDEGITESGTSMAAPMVAGLAALVVSKNPGWTPEQVKADIMNTAGEDLFTGDNHTGDTYAPNRVGAGRIQADRALANDVLAYVAEDPGAVSVSFGPLEVTEPVTLTKHITVENTGSTTRTYDTSYDAITSVPGVEYTVSPASVTVAGGESQPVTVTLSIADPTALTKTVDPTHGNADSQGLPLQTLADASGRVLLTPQSGSAPQLRVPVYSAPRPASSMTQPAALTFKPGATTATLGLTGTGVDQGAGAESVFSLVSGFELQAKSGVLPACADVNDSNCASTQSDKAADLKYVGVTSDAPYSDPDSAMAYFAIASQGVHGTAAGQAEYDLYLDTNRDGTPDLVAYNGRYPDEDLMLTILIDLNTGDVVDYEFTNILPGDTDTATYDSDVIVMPIWLTALADYGVNPDNPRIDYALQTFSYSRNGEVDEAGWDGEDVAGTLSADLFTPGLTVVDESTDSPFVVSDDQDGTDLTVTRNAASYAADGGKGLLMVHFHNAVGSKAQVVKVNAPKGEGTVKLRAPKRVKSGHQVRATVTVQKRSGVTPTGTVTVRTTSGHKLGSAELKNGRAKVRFKVHGHGKLKIEAYYAGDDSYQAGTSRPRTIRIK